MLLILFGWKELMIYMFVASYDTCVCMCVCMHIQQKAWKYKY